MNSVVFTFIKGIFYVLLAFSATKMSNSLRLFKTYLLLLIACNAYVMPGSNW